MKVKIFQGNNLQAIESLFEGFVADGVKINQIHQSQGADGVITISVFYESVPTRAENEEASRRLLRSFARDDD